jgi:HlyD family secretion protein
MLEGVVRNVSADSAVETDAGASGAPAQAVGPVFKALIELGSQELAANGLRLPLAAGMQVSAEIMQGERTVLEYLLSPVQRVASEAGKER